ncbi:MAG TPA: thioredoxin family protein [Flavobacteriaceae bacterium]|nr:thioredoxin family protein [Flavobacteriaceae bacterium]
MKLFILAFVFVLSSFTLQSQNWLTNFQEAKSMASDSNENIVLVFQGSDWCAPCIKLDREIWSTSEFQNLAKDHFVLMKADFPRKKANRLSAELKAQNDALAERYDSHGFFPLVVVLDKNGNVLGKMGYEKLTPMGYFNKLTAMEN